MKKAFALFVLGLLFFNVQAQDKTDLPNVSIKNLDGESINISELNNDGKPFVMTFWATWCAPCVKEHNALSEVYEEWQEETGVKIFSVTIDDSRNTAKIRPFVEGKGWEFDILLDVNKELARHMNVSNPPHTFLFDGNGKIVYQHNGYFEGAETELFEKIKEIAK